MQHKQINTNQQTLQTCKVHDSPNHQPGITKSVVSNTKTSANQLTKPHSKYHKSKQQQLTPNNKASNNQNHKTINPQKQSKQQGATPANK